MATRKNLTLRCEEGNSCTQSQLALRDGVEETSRPATTMNKFNIIKTLRYRNRCAAMSGDNGELNSSGVLTHMPEKHERNRFDADTFLRLVVCSRSRSTAHFRGSLSTINYSCFPSRASEGENRYFGSEFSHKNLILSSRFLIRALALSLAANIA